MTSIMFAAKPAYRPVATHANKPSFAANHAFSVATAPRFGFGANEANFFADLVEPMVNVGTAIVAGLGGLCLYTFWQSRVDEKNEEANAKKREAENLANPKPIKPVVEQPNYTNSSSGSSGGSHRADPPAGGFRESVDRFIDGNLKGFW